MSYKTMAGVLAVGAAISPQALTAASTISGLRIISPGTSARKLGFVIMTGSLTSVTVLTIGVQYCQNFSSGSPTWNNYLQFDNTTAMTFTATKTIAAAQLDTIVNGGNGYLFGSLDLQRANDGDYRLNVSTLTGANITISASYILFDSFRHPINDPATYDDLLIKQQRSLTSSGVPTQPGTLPQSFG